MRVGVYISVGQGRLGPQWLPAAVAPRLSALRRPRALRAPRAALSARALALRWTSQAARLDYRARDARPVRRTAAHQPWPAGPAALVSQGSH